MPFFLVLPLWLAAVILGLLLVCFRLTRHAGIYLIATSTFATITSFVLAYGVLLAGAWIAVNPGRHA